jgi:integrase
VSEGYRDRALLAVRRLMAEVPVKTIRDLRRETTDPWSARALAGKMKARARGYYREALLAFAGWCVGNGKLTTHDLDKLPKPDPKADPVRPRRALTEDEFARLLAVARTRSLDDRRTVQRGERKGKRVAKLRPDVAKRLDELGRERVLISRTFLLTGLRWNELRTLSVRNLDLTPGAEVIRLDRKDERSGAGSTLPFRSDLADELRQGIAEKKLKTADLLFAVPARLRLTQYRDLKAAGIPRTDDRGRVLDVHAMATKKPRWHL